MRRFPGFLLGRSSLALTVLAVAWLVEVSVLLDYHRALASFTNQVKLDLRWGYTTSDVNGLWEAYGTRGRQVYEQATWWDMLYALLTGLFVSRLAHATLGARLGMRALGHWVPWSFAALDIAENLLLLGMLRVHPVVSDGLVAVSSGITCLKRLPLGLSFGILGWCIVRLANRVLRSGPPSTSLLPLSERQRRALWLGALFVSLPLSVVQAVVWHGAEAPVWMLSLISPESLGQQAIAYQRFGRLFAGVLLVLLVLLHHPSQRGWLRWQERLVLVALIADIGTYWIAGWSNPTLRAVTFWGIEVPCWLALGVGNTVRGALARKRGEPRREVAKLLLFPAMLLSAATLRYLPHALVLPVLALSPWLVNQPVDSSHSVRERTVLLSAASLLALAVIAWGGFLGCSPAPRYRAEFPPRSRAKPSTNSTFRHCPIGTRAHAASKPRSPSTQSDIKAASTLSAPPPFADSRPQLPACNNPAGFAASGTCSSHLD